MIISGLECKQHFHPCFPLVHGSDPRDRKSPGAIRGISPPPVLPLRLGSCRSSVLNCSGPTLVRSSVIIQPFLKSAGQEYPLNSKSASHLGTGEQLRLIHRGFSTARDQAGSIPSPAGATQNKSRSERLSMCSSHLRPRQEENRNPPAY